MRSVVFAMGTHVDADGKPVTRESKAGAESATGFQRTRGSGSSSRVQRLWSASFQLPRPAPSLPARASLCTAPRGAPGAGETRLEAAACPPGASGCGGRGGPGVGGHLGGQGVPS